jgi:peptidoglycan/xylan/chitin deacetylase (PgdA/CDA1 family)
VLRELRVSATVFVTTGKIGSSNPFWQQSLGGLFRDAFAAGNGRLERLSETVGIENSDLPARELFRTVVAHWKRLPSSEVKDRLARADWHALPNDEKTRCFLSEAEIREMAQSGIAFGSHTVNHVILSRENESVVRSELEASRSVLESILDSRVDTLAYPDGDCRERDVALAERAGYRIGCTTRGGRVATGDNHLLLPRVEPEWDCPNRARSVFNEYEFQWRAR